MCKKRDKEELEVTLTWEYFNIVRKFSILFIRFVFSGLWRINLGNQVKRLPQELVADRTERFWSGFRAR